jgi:hypothetical protein
MNLRDVGLVVLVGMGMFELTLDGRVIFVDEVALNELNSQSRLANTCGEIYEGYARIR